MDCEPRPKLIPAMPKRANYARAHAGKKAFPTKAEADAAILRWQGRGLHGLGSYKCPFGKHWHAGHKKKTKATTVKEQVAPDPATNSASLTPDEGDSL
jgi:hypothetical protein